MKLRTKAILFNALIYPGTGHLFARRYKSAAAIMVTFSLILVGFFQEIVSKIQPLVDKVMSGQLALTQQAIAEELYYHPIAIDVELMQLLWLFILGCWLVAIIDACRINTTDNED